MDARERELLEVVEQQAATSEILRLISRSQDTAQPVFETIAKAALKLFGARSVNLFTFDGKLLHVAALARAHSGATDNDPVHRDFPRPPGREMASTRAVLTCDVVAIPDVLEDPEYKFSETALAGGFRSLLAVPLMRAAGPIGTIVVGHPRPGPFPDSHVALLRTFADQAVIAIENVRLFKELQVRNRELTEALEKQKATSETLRAEIDAHKRSRATIHVLVEEMRAGTDSMVGNSVAMQRVREQIAQVAPTDSTVLIQGETGTGKELVARAIHDRSARRERPLITVNCAALPRELVESELFGHEKGAFTGAVQQRRGRFELADGGTLFLDEVGEMPPEAQAKLLRALQERTFERVGGSHSLRTDVRVIAASNRDLNRGGNGACFRPDLYYRLNVFPITLPSLRERRDDIPDMLRHFAMKMAPKLGRTYIAIAPTFLDRASTYDWPGNVRELENLVERALILHRGGTLDGAGLLSSVDRPGSAPAPAGDGTLEDMERAHIHRVLEATRWRIEGENGAAERLGINPSTLRNRMRKLAIRKDS